MAYYGYHRTSTDEQHLDRGISTIKDYAKNSGIELLDIYTDQQTGKNFDRPEYQFIKKRLRAGDCLIITEVDRLGRNKNGILKELRDFRERGVRIMILEIPTTLMNLDSLHDDLGRMLLETITNMMIEIYATFAEAEVHKRERRQREGLDAMKARGEWGKYGRPRSVEFSEFKEAYRKVLSGEHRPIDCIKDLRISRQAYYRYKKEFEEN